MEMSNRQDRGELLSRYALPFFARCHECHILFGTDFAEKKRAGMGFDSHACPCFILIYVK